MSGFSQQISDALSAAEFSVVKQLPASEVSKFRLIDDMVDQILDAIEDILDRAEAEASKQSSGDLLKLVGALQSAAAEFEKDLKSYTGSQSGHPDRQKLHRLQSFMGYDTVQLQDFLRQMKHLAKGSPDLLLGTERYVNPTSLRNRFGVVLLRVYVSAGGIVSKTKSKDKNLRNHAAFFLMQVSKCLESIERIPRDSLFLKHTVAERFAARNADRINAKGR